MKLLWQKYVLDVRIEPRLKLKETCFFEWHYFHMTNPWALMMLRVYNCNNNNSKYFESKASGYLEIMSMYFENFIASGKTEIS